MLGNDHPPAAAVFGCAGTVLSDVERRFFAETDPLGFILFARNIDTPAQVRTLVDSLRETVGRADAPVLIDQEGGRVQRLAPPGWRRAPAAAVFSRRAASDPSLAAELVRLNYRLIGRDLADLGIDVDCAPVIDVPVPGADDIIGDRAFGANPDQVALLGRAAMDGLLDEGVVPVVKHCPGHGRATADSHKSLPVVDVPLDALEARDFAPFRALVDAPWAMTAHVVYRAIDPEAPATISAKVIGDVIRGAIGFSGVLVSDDLSMRALGGPFDERARAALAAGCDLVLHCNGDMDEMKAVAQGIRRLDSRAMERLSRAAAMKRSAPPLDVKHSLQRLATELGEA